VLRERGATFWAAAEALLGASLAAIHSSFRGTLLIHPYLTDLAFGVERPDRVARLIEACRRHSPQARVGVHSNLAADVARLDVVGARLDAIHVLSSPNALGVPRAICLLRSLWPSAEIVAEVGPACASIQRAAANEPARWLHGADAVLVGASACEEIAPRARERRARAWDEAFPGLPMPAALA